MIADLASVAAARWGGQVRRSIADRENAVFEISLPSGRAALRLHRSGYQDAEAIESELWWSSSLASAGVAVPAALPSLAGPMLQQLPGGRFASVIAWVDGAAIGSSGKPFSAPEAELFAQHLSLGRLLAQIHTATDKLDLPPDFRRTYWDVAGFVGEMPLWGRFWEHPAARPEQSATLTRARAFLRDKLMDFAAAADFGLIHADVLRENVLANDAGLTLIDFDDSGFGFREYDLGTALSQNLYEPAYQGIRDALIAGYTETRNASVEMVELFVLARTCASVGWTMPRFGSGDPTCARQIDRAVMWSNRLGV